MPAKSARTETPDTALESQAGPPEERRCTHAFADGRRCRNRRWRGKEQCYHHDPAAAELREHAAELGQETRHGGLRVATATELHELLARTMEKVAAGKLPVGRAYAVGYLSQLLLKNLEAVEEEFRWANLHEELAEESARRIQAVDAGEYSEPGEQEEQNPEEPARTETMGAGD